MSHSMNILGNKWTLIICVLSVRVLSFGQLLVRIENISRKVLTEQLLKMEQCAIIFRETYFGTPPRVEYSLTEKGKELIPILNQLCGWSKEIHIPNEKVN